MVKMYGSMVNTEPRYSGPTRIEGGFLVRDDRPPPPRRTATHTHAYIHDHQDHIRPLHRHQ
jgi:hypothetical protein